MTRPGIEPRSPGPLANTLLIRPMARYKCIYVNAGFLPSSGSGSTTVWMHHMNVSKTDRGKATWKLNKNATNYFEQILEATDDKTTNVKPLTSH